MTRWDSSSHARDLGGEEVNAVAVEVAAGAVVVLGGAGVGASCVHRDVTTQRHLFFDAQVEVLQRQSAFLFRVTRRKEPAGEHLVRKPVHRSELQALRQNPVRPSKRYQSAPKCWPNQSDDLTVPNWRGGGQPNMGLPG